MDHRPYRMLEKNSEDQVTTTCRHQVIAGRYKFSFWVSYSEYLFQFLTQLKFMGLVPKECKLESLHVLLHLVNYPRSLELFGDFGSRGRNVLITHVTGRVLGWKLATTFLRIPFLSCSRLPVKGNCLREWRQKMSRIFSGSGRTHTRLLLVAHSCISCITHFCLTARSNTVRKRFWYFRFLKMALWA